jgi:hypothetical protein
MLLSIAYLANLILNVLSLKAVTFYYGLNNFLFSCILYGQFFPFVFFYFLYSGLSINRINFIIGFIDYVELIFLYIGFSGINVVQYLSYRNMSIVINFMLSYLFLEKEFCNYQKIGMFLIFISCLILLFLGGTDNMFYSLMILVYSFLYSIIGFLIEKYKENIEFIHIKLVSSSFQISTYLFYSLFNNTVFIELQKGKTIGLFALMIFIGGSEYIYYFLKNRIIQTVQNGSIYTNILDLIRRGVTMILGIYIFNETNPSYVYYCYSVMSFGCFLFYFNEQIRQRIDTLFPSQTSTTELVTV